MQAFARKARATN